MQNKKSSSIAGSFLWKMLERGAAQIITLIVQIVLARILLPDQFGAISILLVFINIANVFIQKGFASSLIRKKDICSDDYDSAFVISEIIAVVCIVLLWLGSGLVESFYHIESLGLYLRVLSFCLVFGALYSIQNAELVREMQFKQIFIRSVIASISSGVIGIVMAMLGMGIWSLVIQSLSQQIISCLTTYFVCNWKPRFCFSKKSFYELYSFGSKILVAELISVFVENIRTLIIGRRFSPEDLAYYDRGQTYPATAMRSIYDTISSVMLPVFSKIQSEKEKLARSVEISLKISMYIVCPLFFGFAVVSRPFTILLLTEKWEMAIPYMIIFSIYQIAFPVYGIARQSLYALGLSGSVLKLEIIRSGLFLLAIFIGVFFDTFTMTILSCVAMYVTTFFYMFVVKKHIPLRFRDLGLNLSKTIIQCAVMCGSIYLVNNFINSMILQLFVDIICGVLVYVVLSIILRNESYDFCYSYIKDKFNNRRT